MRSALALDEDWAASEKTWEHALRALRRAMEDAGVMVVVNSIVGNNTHRRLDVEEFRGFVLVDQHAPLAFINGADAKAAQMFTLAHELAHIFLGSSAAFDLRQMQAARDPGEQACDRIAAEFLVPADQLGEEWAAVAHAAQPFQDLAKRFKVSEIVVARRSLDLGLIGREAFVAFYDEYRREWQGRAAAQKPGGGNFFASQDLRVGRRFASAVVRAVRNHDLLYSEAFELTGLHGDTFDKYASRIADQGEP